RFSPLCPFCPPGFLPERSRRLVTRAGFFSPSLDGGLPLFELFKPSRRSSSAICAFKAAISAACAAISAISSSRDGSAGESGFIESLNRTPIPMSRKIYGPDFAKPPTQPGQRRKLSRKRTDFWPRRSAGLCGPALGRLALYGRGLCPRLCRMAPPMAGVYRRSDRRGWRSLGGVSHARKTAKGRDGKSLFGCRDGSHGACEVRHGCRKDRPGHVPDSAAHRNLLRVTNPPRS